MTQLALQVSSQFQQLYNLSCIYNNGTVVEGTTTSENLLHLPFVNYTCMEMNGCYTVQLMESMASL